MKQEAATTHYCEVLDLFNRRDNIWIAKTDSQVYLDNMYDDYEIRTELLKSRQFYNNAFQTAVNYDELMNMKREIRNAGHVLICRSIVKDSTKGVTHGDKQHIFNKNTCKN